MTSAREQPDALRRRSVTWIVSLATVGLVFDGYDLVVYGALVPLFLRNPGEIGEVTPRWPARWAATRSSGCSSAHCSRAASATSSGAGRSC